MKVLRAKNTKDIGYNIFEINVKDIILSANMKWLNKRLDTFRISVAEKGMLYPIIITNFENYWLKEKRWPKDANGDFIKSKFIVHTGNKRVVWAKEQHFDKIEAYIVKSKEEQAYIIKRTFIHQSNWLTK
jgi:hypothetical protein